MTIVKEIHDINDRLRVAAEATAPTYGAGRRRAISASAAGSRSSSSSRRLEAEMRHGREAARVRAGGRAPRRDPGDPAAGAEEDASVAVGRAAEAAAKGAAEGRAVGRAAPAVEAGRARQPAASLAPGTAAVAGSDAARVARDPGCPHGARGLPYGVTVRVVPAGEEPADASPPGRHRVGLAARHPRRARGRGRRLAGPLAGPPDLGPDRHAERAPPDGPPISSAAALSGRSGGQPTVCVRIGVCDAALSHDR